MSAIVEVEGLQKVYRRIGGGEVVAVRGLDLILGTPGTVHGFLGPNGSGKTTTIRCLLGLVRPTGGETRVFGVESKNFAKVAGRVGAIVENPKMFPKFSGYKNLSLLARMGNVPKSEIDRLLEVVGLADRGGDSFESYSLGMKQRLAIAAALLKNPDLLILDEPANGLDPAGIAEMRVLIRSIADEGRAVLVSSHQLAEIEQVCDEVTIISNGALVQTGSLDTIRSQAASDSVIVTIDDRAAAAAVLQQAGIVTSALPQPDELKVEIAPERNAEVTRILADSGRYLRGLRVERATLEQAFLNLTGAPGNGEPPTHQPGLAPQQQALPPGLTPQQPGTPSEPNLADFPPPQASAPAPQSPPPADGETQ